MTEYFIKHSVITLIINAIILLIGCLSLSLLSLQEYPVMHFSKVRVYTHYPSASPEVVENSVTSPLEDQLAGIEGLETITSDSQYGESYISLNFKKGISIDKSLIAIREAISMTNLPATVKPPIIERKTSSSDVMPFMVIALEAPDIDLAELTHYANLNLKNAFRSIKGVTSAEILGQPYIYNIALDSKRMYTFGVNVDDVFNALQQRSAALPAGKFQNEIPVTLNSELKTLKDYEELVVKTQNSINYKSRQQVVLLKQIADIALKTDASKFRVRINGKPGLCIIIQKSNNANPLEVSTLVRKQLHDLMLFAPQDIQMRVISDQADFIKNSLTSVKSSIFEAIAFVVIIVFIFLRNIKASIIPLVTIPISLIGSCIFLKMCGCSLNIMTLLAMVLAIGLVVDDAIVVLENIQRHIDNGLTPYKAAIRGAAEIGFTIIAMTLTLATVYAPLIFISGTIGELFIEFAVALAGSVLVSGVVALTLSPLMCAKTLKNHNKHLWPQIDTFLEYLAASYKSALYRFILWKKTCVFTLFISLCVIILLLYSLPHETAPKEDRNLIGAYVSSVPGQNIESIEQKVSSVEKKITSLPEITNNLVLIGDWGGNIILPLKPQHSRKRSAQEIINSIRPIVSKLPSIDVYLWNDDSGLPGSESSMKTQELSLIISAAEDYSKLFETAENVCKSIESQHVFNNVRHDLVLDTPGYRIDMNSTLMSRLDLSPQQIAKTVEVFFSGDQSLTFTKNNVLYSIILTGTHSPWSLEELYITNKFDKRISIGAVAEIIPIAEPNTLFHYNQTRAVTLSTDLPSNTAFDVAMKQFFVQATQILPQQYKKTWSGHAKSFNESRNTMTSLFILAIVFIYAILAIQFESFTYPLIILLTVPLACLGGLGLTWISGYSLNIYTHIGLITLIGLITKHGILIVEFANQLQQHASSPKEAIVQAASLRLRPILMTTSAMVFGAIPLILFNNDAGHEARHAIGVVLIGGLIIGTVFTLFVLPIIYYTFQMFVKHQS